MSILNKQTKQETIIYTIVWIVLFLSPLVSFFFSHEDTSMDSAWIKRSLLDSWVTLLSFLIVFLIHNYVLAPIIQASAPASLSVLIWTISAPPLALAPTAWNSIQAPLPRSLTPIPNVRWHPSPMLPLQPTTRASG